MLYEKKCILREKKDFGSEQPRRNFRALEGHERGRGRGADSHVPASPDVAAGGAEMAMIHRGRNAVRDQPRSDTMAKRHRGDCCAGASKAITAVLTRS